MKKILFTVNTLGRAGAETALMELLKRLEGTGYEVSLYVIMGQGEMIGRLPSYVKLLNPVFNPHPVLSRKGRRGMGKTVCRAFFRNGGWIGKLRCMAACFASMRRQGRIWPEKLLWRVLSDGALRFEEEYDLAVAWLEGASAYYVADHVRAVRKCGFIHIDYESAGYTKEMDQGCWDQFDRIFTVSEEVKGHFLKVYPQYASKTEVFHNLLDRGGIRLKAAEGAGFSDGYEGPRLLTVGRLTFQKAYDIAIDAMKLLKDSGKKARWYVLGEGDQRRALEKKIAALGLREDFVLLGDVENPFPFYKQTDIYVHATRFEGKSIAVQEAQILGCAIIASDCNGNREQIADGQDGILCELTPEAVAGSIAALLEDVGKREALGRRAELKYQEQERDLRMFLELLEQEPGEAEDEEKGIADYYTGL